MRDFETFPEQEAAKRLLRAALADGPVHAYLFHGPRGVGKRRAALAFAGELLGDLGRVERRAHPDVYVLEPLGDQIRIDDIRALRRDLHLRPFEADRRVYLIFGADRMNEDAADALLKDLEEPPAYVCVVLVADELGSLPETIRSRCQPVPFRRLSERAVRDEIARLAPGLADDQKRAFARAASGRLDRAKRLLDADAIERRTALLGVARGVYRDSAFEPSEAAATLLEGTRARGLAAKDDEVRRLEAFDLPTREAEQRARRAQHGAEREELLAALEELAAWYRDLVVVAAGAEGTATHADRLAELVEDGTRDRMVGAERAAEVVRETWRVLEEFNLNPGLALEALFIRLRRELAGPVAA